MVTSVSNERYRHDGTELDFLHLGGLFKSIINLEPAWATQQGTVSKKVCFNKYMSTINSLLVHSPEEVVV